MEGKRAPRSTKTDKDQKALENDQRACNSSGSMGILSNKTTVCDNQQFTVLYTNADCLTNKIDELRLLLSTLDYKPTAIVVTEVNAKVSACPMQEFEFNIDGYILGHG